jgi:hypothetical protein
VRPCGVWAARAHRPMRTLRLPWFVETFQDGPLTTAASGCGWRAVWSRRCATHWRRATGTHGRLPPRAWPRSASRTLGREGSRRLSAMSDWCSARSRRRWSPQAPQRCGSCQIRWRGRATRSWQTSPLCTSTSAMASITSPAAAGPAAAWRAASSACGRIGVVTNLPDTTTSTQTDVLEAGRSARLVVVDAYDGEGALYLSDSGRPPAG